MTAEGREPLSALIDGGFSFARRQEPSTSVHPPAAGLRPAPRSPSGPCSRPSGENPPANRILAAPVPAPSSCARASACGNGFIHALETSRVQYRQIFLCALRVTFRGGDFGLGPTTRPGIRPFPRGRNHDRFPAGVSRYLQAIVGEGQCVFLANGD